MPKGDGPARPIADHPFDKYDLRLQAQRRRRLEAVAERLGIPPRTFAREAIMRTVEEAARRFAGQPERGG